MSLGGFTRVSSRLLIARVSYLSHELSWKILVFSLSYPRTRHENPLEIYLYGVPSPTEKFGGLTPSLWKIRSLPWWYYKYFLEPYNLHQYRLPFFSDCRQFTTKISLKYSGKCEPSLSSVLHSGITSDAPPFFLVILFVHVLQSSPL